MLCAIRHRDRQKVAAWDQQKSNGPFLCPLCVEETTLKKGTMKFIILRTNLQLPVNTVEVRPSDIANES
jgi:hypothetical protein